MISTRSGNTLINKHDHVKIKEIINLWKDFFQYALSHQGDSCRGANKTEHS